MALFESYERREKQVLAKLAEYGIDSIEGAAEVTKAAGLDVYKMVEGIQPICFENAKWGLHGRRRHRYQERLPQGFRGSSSPSARDCSPSVFPAPWQTAEK